MNFYVSGDKYGLIRMGKKRAFVSLFHDQIPSLGIAFATNEDRPAQRESVLIHRVSLTSFGALTQDDAAAAGYLYLHQLHEDLQKQNPEIVDESLIRIAYFERAA